MDCRTARTLMNDESTLAPDEQWSLAAHLASCPACRDDRDDPIAHALTRSSLELALPPPDFTLNVLQRLPQESPSELARRAARQQQRRWIMLSVGAVALLGVLAALGVSLQSVLAGTSLGLTAQVLREVAEAAAGPLITAIASAIVVGLLLEIVVRRPTAGRALGSAALAGSLLIVLGFTIRASDQVNTTRAGAKATIFSAIPVEQATPGDVASLGGDITLLNRVNGNVGTLFGDVTLRPQARVAGSVLAGDGTVEGAPGQVAGAVREGIGGLALSKALFGDNAGRQSSGFAQSLAALLGALVTLTLAGLAVLLWPDRTLRASRVLPTAPWVALGLGSLITVLLALLALPVLAFLALTVVGLLLTPLLLLIVHLPYVQGLAAVGQALGQRLTGTTTITGALWGVAAQLVLVIGLGVFSPLVGIGAFYLLASLGLGALLLGRRAHL